MSRRTCSCSRCRPAAEPPTVAAPVAGEEMRICRHVHPIPIPAPVTPGLSEVLSLLRRQNVLLAEILAAVRAGEAETE